MVIKPEPVFNAVEHVLALKERPESETRIVLMTPQGELFNQEKAKELAQVDDLILICGHYEGF